MRGVGELPGGLGDGTPLPMPAGMPNPAVGSRGAQNGNRRYMGGGGGDDGGGGGGGSGGYATQGYDSQRSQGYPSQDGYGMHSTQQSLGCLSLDSSQPGYASQGYDAQVQPRATRHAPTRPRAHALPRPRAAAPPRGRAGAALRHALRRPATASHTRVTPHRAVTAGCRMLRRATTAPNRIRSRTEHPSRRATREVASRSHKTRRVTPSPPTRKTTPATAAPMTMGRHTWPMTTARQHRSRGRTHRAREHLSLPHPVSCLLYHWPAVLRDGSGHDGDDGKTPAPHPFTNAPECRPRSPRVHATTPHEIQVRLQTSASASPPSRFGLGRGFLHRALLSWLVQCSRRQRRPRGQERAAATIKRQRPRAYTDRRRHIVQQAALGCKLFWVCLWDREVESWVCVPDRPTLFYNQQCFLLKVWWKLKYFKGVYSDSQCGIRKVDVNYIDFPCPSPVSKLA